MTTDPDAVARRVHARLLDQPVVSGVGPEAALEIARLVRTEAPLLNAEVCDDVVRRVLARTVGLGPLEPLAADPDVTEIMVNGPGVVWVERAGDLHPTSIHVDAAAVDLLVERLTGSQGQRVDRAAPMTDLRLADGSRCNIVVPPIAVDGTAITIRRFRALDVTLDDLAPADAVPLLVDAVRSRRNIVVVGGTGAGKTTLLNALCAHLPLTARVVTVEDAAELALPGDHVVRLESRRANTEGVGSVTIRDLVRNALRMRPDRIVVGEVRGAEALDMVWAMSTGHDGSLSTCHANGAADALARLETMVLQAGVDLPLEAARSQIAAAVDLIVHVARGPGGSRGVVAVSEVIGPGRVRPVIDLAPSSAPPPRPLGPPALVDRQAS